MARGADRRQFGRRWSHVHGWIHIEGRPRIPCLIRNFSEAGALLEFDCPANVLSRFRLEIDVVDFAINCEVRHHTARRAGVRFLASARADEPQQVPTIDELMARATAADSPDAEKVLAAIAAKRRA